jgi:hypothetical protein
LTPVLALNVLIHEHSQASLSKPGKLLILMIQSHTEIGVITRFLMWTKTGLPLLMHHPLSTQRTIFGFIGITDITFIYAEGLAFGEEVRAKSLATARAALQEAVINW